VSDRWAPFRVAAKGERADAARPLGSTEGVGDRLRVAAFAEIQARDAFLWAAERFGAGAPSGLPEAWRRLAAAEQKHLDWLLRRMQELGVDPAARTVSDQLWDSLLLSESAEEFSLYMASAEERGRRAGERFCEALAAVDPVSSRIFGDIAREEVAHIELALAYFPEAAARHLRGNGATFVRQPASALPGVGGTPQPGEAV
jgi:uncharacterized ferritin-like protein (DUF455 family)